MNAGDHVCYEFASSALATLSELHDALLDDMPRGSRLLDIDTLLRTTSSSSLRL